jgi:hypothetical protein
MCARDLGTEVLRRVGGRTSNSVCEENRIIGADDTSGLEIGRVKSTTGARGHITFGNDTMILRVEGGRMSFLTDTLRSVWESFPRITGRWENFSRITGLSFFCTMFFLGTTFP